ncbi:zinc ABC transporter permease, partial [Salmonella enterica subsp. enterica serovar Typhimurium]|nr:zinc ABC transporter permease [Salmonella enterica subsp. enterica serovar Typhimurium]EBV7671992.1 zinc ABC transporter permease [Salmonella enterica subsp. enterica serovar Saintpaul]ECG5140631.1 zinc ABC transporter permease [Salmonella enterica subsp. enterica serovar Typhimurium]
SVCCPVALRLPGLQNRPGLMSAATSGAKASLAA